MRPVRVDFPYLMADRDRHGNRRFYVRRNGRKIRIRANLGTEGFARAYADALFAIDHPDDAKHGGVERAPAGSLGWLAACYFGELYGNYIHDSLSPSWLAQKAAFGVMLDIERPEQVGCPMNLSQQFGVAIAAVKEPVDGLLGIDPPLRRGGPAADQFLPDASALEEAQVAIPLSRLKRKIEGLGAPIGHHVGEYRLGLCQGRDALAPMTSA